MTMLRSAPNGRPAAASVRLFAGAARRYWLQVFPAARAVRRDLRARAEAIPDPVLREDALISHGQKSSNSEGLAAMAILAPARQRAAVARSLVSYQLMLDYLDGVSERPSRDPLENGMRLHRAFEVALDPGAPHEDYYDLSTFRRDGGYLETLIETCRKPLRSLPSYGEVRPALLRQALLCRQSQALNHARQFRGLDAELASWADGAGVGAGVAGELDWWELLAAAAASSLSVGALLALAATPGAGETDARRVESAYFPWASGLNALLDSLVDLDEDPAEVSHLRRYPSRELAAERMVLFASSARGRVSALPEGRTHEAILAAMGALYLARPEAWRPDRRAVSAGVLEALGPFAGPSLVVHLLRRGGRGGRAVLAARRRPEAACEIHTRDR